MTRKMVLLLLALTLLGCTTAPTEKKPAVGLFELKVNHTDLEVPAGGSVQLPVEVVWTRPPTATVSLSVQVEPEQRGVKAHLEPTSWNNSEQPIQLLIEAAPQLTGRCAVRIKGQSSTQSQELTLSVSVVP